MIEFVRDSRGFYSTDIKALSMEVFIRIYTIYKAGQAIEVHGLRGLSIVSFISDFDISLLEINCMYSAFLTWNECE